MISYATYKIVHLLGVMMVFLALGGLTTHFLSGGEKNFRWRKPIAITHGVGLFLSLLGGFGLLARLGIVHGGLPQWVWAKLIIWVLFALSIGVLIRKPAWSKSVWFLTLILGGVAAYLAGSKPF